ncbi:MAG: Smr/MutS family protein, partial [Bacteroidota bacterium]|nr:Smr/MutS family protein [Bacteroidota bacterium]
KPIGPQLLKEQMFENTDLNQEGKGRGNIFAKPPSEVDLHIEMLVGNHGNMSNGEILQLQISTFEKLLDQAIASGMDEITFIHGSGNGVLKNAIHKKLSKLPGIKFFKDAKKEKFGYGATTVGLG